MKVLITGGWGFLGSQLAKLLLERGVIRNRRDEPVPITEIVLFDAVEPEDTGGLLAGGGGVAVKSRVGDITDAACCVELIDSDDVCVFHLAGVMSGASETDFDLAWRVNVLGAANLLQACRARDCGIRIVFTSTHAVFGEQPSEGSAVSDGSKLRPTNTYGMTKAACELLVNDMTRKGFVDGRVARLPTVIVRPGSPNAAATSCFSGIVREPLAGIDVEIPVSRDLKHAVIGLRCCVRGILDLHEAPLKRMEEICRSDRAVNLPSLSATLGEIETAMRDVAAKNGIPEHNLGKIEYKRDDFLTEIVASMACATDFSRATSLGLESNPTLTEVVSQYFDAFVDDSSVSGSL